MNGAKRNARALRAVVKRVIALSEVEDLGFRPQRDQLEQELVAALVEAGAVIPEKTVITINIQPSRPEVQPVFPHRPTPNTSRYFR